MISVPGRAFRSLAAVVLSAALLAYGGTLAFAQDSSEHALRVKSPFAGDVWRADVSADESYVSVSSAYASISTWALDVPGVPDIARLPVRNEEHKRAHAVALHPSGELVAYSAPPVIAERDNYRPGSSVIYLVSRTTGDVIRVLGRPSDDIATRPQALRFSPDGKHLASVLSSGCGLRVWSTESWELEAKDDVGYGGVTGEDLCCRSGSMEACDRLPDSNSLAFLADDNVARWQLVTSGDTGLRVYRLTNNRLDPDVLFVVAARNRPRASGWPRCEPGRRLDRGRRSPRGERDCAAALSNRCSQPSDAAAEPRRA